MSVCSPDRMAHAHDDARGIVERISDVGAEVQQLGPADPVMIQPLFVGEVVGKKVVIVVVAVMTVCQNRRSLKRKPAREKVTELKFGVAAFGSNVRHFLRESKRIAPLDKCLWQDRIQAAPEIHANAILAEIDSDGGMRQGRVVVAWYGGLKERYYLQRSLTQAVAHVETEVLQRSMKASVVQRDRRFGPSADQRMSVATHVLPADVRQRYSHRKLVGEREIRVQNYATQEDMAAILGPAIGVDMKAIEAVLIEYRSGPLASGR